MKKNKKLNRQDQFSQFLIYSTPDNKVKIEIFVHNENAWLTQAKIAELFGVDRSVVTKHLRNIYEERELDKKSTCANFAQVQTEGKRQVTREID